MGDLINNYCKKRRILTIDGGGILGTFPAAFLANLEDALDRPIGEYFDLICGTSTGGIIALGLGMGLKASEILEMYEKRGPEIFGQSGGLLENFLAEPIRRIRWLYRPKYSSEKLRSVLIDLFGSKTLGDAKHRLVIPAWNPTARTVYLYKTPHHPRFNTSRLSPKGCKLKYIDFNPLSSISSRKCCSKNFPSLTQKSKPNKFFKS